MRSRTDALVASLIVALCASSGIAAAQTASDDRRPDPVRLRFERATPGKVFFKGAKRARFEYEIAATKRRDVVVEVMRRGGTEPVQWWRHEAVEPDETQTQTWGGAKRGKGKARSGRYLFRVRERGGALAERSRAAGTRSFGYYTHRFPVRGRHTYGDGIGAGRGHQGQDMFARCGTRVEAARAGKVQYKGFQGGGAGHYLVIDGRKTGRDYVFMHLRRRARVRRRQRVKTGEKIGEVGRSGNASGCHLHFELWSKPGWYEGGRFLNPRKKLKRWDRWS